MTFSHETEDPLDRELLSEQLVGTALRGRLALITGDDEAVSALLGELAVELADSTEVARLDASISHKAASLVRALVTPLNVGPDDLLAALHERAEMVPLVLVIDNGECLGSEALKALRALVSRSRGGLGVLVGGEEETSELLAEAGITPAFRAEAGAPAPDSRVDETPPPSRLAELAQLLPWKHLAAVVGLLLLIWLFWPAPDAGQPERSAELALPMPAGQETAEPRSGPGEEEATESGDAEPARPISEEQPETGPAPVEAPEPAETPETVEADSEGPDGTDGGEPANREEPAPATDSREAVGPPREPELSGLEAELGYHREDWLLTRAPGGWMLQLALASDERRARALLDQLGRERGAYYRTRRNGETVYVLVSGPYGSREEALGARETLPADLRETGPFPRSLKAIAEEIRSS